MDVFNVDLYLRSLNENERRHIVSLHGAYPVRNMASERRKLIENGRRTYPNGFVLIGGEVDIFRVNVGHDSGHDSGNESGNESV